MSERESKLDSDQSLPILLTTFGFLLLLANPFSTKQPLSTAHVLVNKPRSAEKNTNYSKKYIPNKAVFRTEIYFNFSVLEYDEGEQIL